MSSLENPFGKPATIRKAGLFAAGLIVTTLLLAVVWPAVRPASSPTPPEPPSPSAVPPARGSARVPLPPQMPRRDLDPTRASELVRLSIRCVDQEYPNKPGNVVDGDSTVRPPRELTPAFYGCFDWHSSVHGHWAMVRVLKRFPRLGEAAAARAKLDAHLTAPNLERELAYFQLERNRTFERPYGWGWLLRLAAELRTWDDPDARRWDAALRPLAEFLSARTAQYLDALSVPIREGTHASTAFALVHMLDYARAAGDSALETAILRRTRDFYLHDTQCPTDYEPSGEDFLSPCLTEADLMRRVLPEPEFVRWLDAFLPPLDSERMRPVLTPVAVRDKTDPRIGHLIGLSLQRAWSMRGIAAAVPSNDPRREVFATCAAAHEREGYSQMFESGYGGEHWLASFAIYAATDAGPYDRR